MDMKPIHKFNGGKGATLCHKCSVIISEGLTEDLYCEKCEQKIKRIMKNIHKIGENIYITSDEEIEKGDWGYNTYTKSIHTIDVVGTKNNQWKKIILTTDQDLIKDGVQAIDDEFLQWFVKNPSCEEVEIDKKENLWFCCDFFEEGQEKYCINSMPRCPKCNSALGGNPDWTDYKIIIPKEEPKCTCKEHDPYCCQVHGICPTCVKKEESKQTLIDMMQDDEELGLYEETLEEAAKVYAEPYRCPATNDNEYCKHDIISAFNNGAKWQAERMYSEEDMLKSFMAGIKCESNKGENFEQFIKQFKNK